MNLNEVELEIFVLNFECAVIAKVTVQTKKVWCASADQNFLDYSVFRITMRIL